MMAKSAVTAARARRQHPFGAGHQHLRLAFTKIEDTLYVLSAPLMQGIQSGFDLLKRQLAQSLTLRKMLGWQRRIGQDFPLSHVRQLAWRIGLREPLWRP